MTNNRPNFDKSSENSRREARLSDALRANLRRRKAAKRKTVENDDAGDKNPSSS